MDTESVRFGPIIEKYGFHNGWLVELKSPDGTAYLYRGRAGSWIPLTVNLWAKDVVWVDLTDEVWRYAFEQECDSDSFKQSMKELIFR
jgi:phage portal protein BeeE